MGEVIGRLLCLFRFHVPDAESAGAVADLIATPSRWSAGHAVFDEIRDRNLAAIKAKDSARCAQYYFEESCCQAAYNASEVIDPFDPSAPFFVANSAFRLAAVVGLPPEEVVAIFAPPSGRE